MAKAIYFFDEGDGTNKQLLGGKGAGLCEMTQLGLPVPPGFIITTDMCRAYYANGERLPARLMPQVRRAMRRLERLTGKRFGDPRNPLLVSVRSGAAISMPGMMDTILNLGLNDRTVEGLAALTRDARFVYDAYRRFIQLFGKIVLRVRDDQFGEVFERIKQRERARYDNELGARALREAAGEFRRICQTQTGRAFPEEPYDQLEQAITAVFKSWMGRRALDYRRQFKITPDIADGTGVSIVTMVFGNMGTDSATGVVFTRDPATGERTLYGEYLANAQGEDIVAGIRTPKPMRDMEREFPEAYRQLHAVCMKLERHYREPQDVEFTIERGHLYMLQTRNAKMNAAAMIRTSVDMVRERLLTKEQALLRINPDDLEQLLHPRVDPRADKELIAAGIAASPGAASGRAIFDADEAERRGRSGERVILVREETKPEDIHGFFASQGVLTSRGGKTSHAAVVARGMGKPCVAGCSTIRIDYGERAFFVDSYTVREGDIITIDGTSGQVFLGEVPTLEPELSPELNEVLNWADEFRRLGVRANADSPEGARLARRFGAEGIGLCRTERMFNASDRLPLVVRMILSDRPEERRTALEQLRPLQREDFKAILRAMAPYPVTIRLLDPPLHEFLPRAEDLLMEIQALRLNGNLQAATEKERILQRVRSLAEINPMLGHRGVRVGVTYPEIYEMQVRAIYEATVELVAEGVPVKTQIMVPQVAMAQELVSVRRLVERVAHETESQLGRKLPVKYGTMIEVVRACLDAANIAQTVEFFSFGTNDLTQGTFSFSREDAENKFLPYYQETGLLVENPFQTIDRQAVGRLMQIAVEEGRRSNPRLEVGICGEHGGDPLSIEFCHRTGLTYVSCSAYRIPVARLAAARAAIRESPASQRKGRLRAGPRRAANSPVVR